MTEPSVDPKAEIAVSMDNDVPTLKPSVGELLKAGRENAGLPLAEVAQRLKLGVRQVEALENGDWGSLPGSTFIRGFVRNYARLVDLDQAVLMVQLDAVLQKPVTVLSVPESAPTQMPYSTSSGRDDRRVVLFGVAAALLAALIYFVLPDDLAELREQTQSVIDSLSRKEEPPVPDPAVVPAPGSDASNSEPVFPPGTTPQQIMSPQSLVAEPVTVADNTGAQSIEKAAVSTSTAQLSFEIVRESWIEVRDRHDKVIFSQRLLAGSQKSVGGDGPLSLVIGYAPGVKLQWRGQAVDLEPFSRGDVARLVLE